jgi:hypothetical protein
VNQTKYIGMDVHQATTFYDSLNVHAESSTYGHSCNRVFGTPVKWGESPHENYKKNNIPKRNPRLNSLAHCDFAWFLSRLPIYFRVTRSAIRLFRARPSWVELPATG